MQRGENQKFKREMPAIISSVGMRRFRLEKQQKLFGCEAPSGPAGCTQHEARSQTHR